MWTRLRGSEGILEGDRRSPYESGIEFTNLTPEQHATLATALETLQAAQATSDRKPSA